MTTYTRKPDGTVRQPDGHLLHPTRYIVKRLSGPQAGTMATFATAEAASTTDQARAERIAAKYTPRLAALIRTHRSRSQ